MHQGLFSIDEARQLILDGKTLLIAGAEELLAQLPLGDWIGGTSPYFIAPNHNGMIAHEQLFISDISKIADSCYIKAYDKNELTSIYNEAGEGGFSVIIIPATSSVHASFALDAPTYDNFGSQPLIGWIAGAPIDQLGERRPRVFNGKKGESYIDHAIIMHVNIVKSKSIDIGHINIFSQGAGDTLTFLEDGFSFTHVLVNGVKVNFTDYIVTNDIDIRLPLIADYYGALVNISLQDVDAKRGVRFYAPVFTGIKYKWAAPLGNYGETLSNKIKSIDLESSEIVFSCNCILNYLHSHLEGNKNEQFTGLISYGEIAYQLLNQTLVYLIVSDI
ncbi:hypothetical protein JWH17_01845 [Desulfobulbus marinus]|nr:hypothetical protein [Desulfogranum marinum]